VTNPHPHPTDFAREIRIRRIRISAGSVTSLQTITLVAIQIHCTYSRIHCQQ